MIGLFIVTDVARQGAAHWWLIPVLFLTLMFGPAGLLRYLVMRFAMSPGSPGLLADAITVLNTSTGAIFRA